MSGNAPAGAATANPVPVGAEAPEFALVDQYGATVRLSEFRGEKAVLLVFYPFAFTGVCTSELKALQRRITTFQNTRVQLLGVSCDSTFVQRAFADEDRLSFPLLADNWPHGGMAQAYGVFDEEIGAACRGTFVIDDVGIVRWNVVNSIPDARSADQYAEVLASL